MIPTPPNKSNCGKILVITGQDLRHQYFVNQLNTRFPLLAVLTETCTYPKPIAHADEEQKAWNWFFTRRKNFEEKTFGPANWTPTLNNPPLIKIPQGKLNAPETLKKISDLHPEFIALFGTGLLGQKFLDRFPRQIFNLHVGLPRYFRGSSCNFWPVHNNRLEELGASVHLTNAGIDTGNIAAWSAIELEDDDNEQTLAGKTLTTGIELMISVIQDWRNKTLNFTTSEKTGELYLRKDFTPGAVLRVRRMVESGELKRQLISIGNRKPLNGV